MKTITEEDIRNDLRYLQLLSQSYPTIADASTEIINLEAILNLPKPTEHAPSVYIITFSIIFSLSIKYICFLF